MTARSLADVKLGELLAAIDDADSRLRCSQNLSESEHYLMLLVEYRAISAAKCAYDIARLDVGPLPAIPVPTLNVRHLREPAWHGDWEL